MSRAGTSPTDQSAHLSPEPLSDGDRTRIGHAFLAAFTRAREYLVPLEIPRNVAGLGSLVRLAEGCSEPASGELRRPDDTLAVDEGGFVTVVRRRKKCVDR